jgi:hypothetical protein
LPLTLRAAAASERINYEHLVALFNAAHAGLERPSEDILRKHVREIIRNSGRDTCNCEPRTDSNSRLVSGPNTKSKVFGDCDGLAKQPLIPSREDALLLRSVQDEINALDLIVREEIKQLDDQALVCVLWWLVYESEKDMCGYRELRQDDYCSTLTMI